MRGGWISRARSIRRRPRRRALWRWLPADWLFCGERNHASAISSDNLEAMPDNSRRFDAGPDPFGRTWHVEFRWLQTGISIRHADTVDVKFVLWTDGEEKQE